MSQEDIRVVIVMATYMGARYVREQVESIQKQSHLNWRLVIRDDQSFDDTVSIVEEMAAADPRIAIMVDGKEHLGHCQNFNELLMANAGQPYVMCCDQDDIWFEEKIESTLEEMLAAELTYPGAPVLVFTDYRVADADGSTLSDNNPVISNIRNLARFDLHSLLGYDYIWGCTIMVNRELLRLALPVSTQAQNHDYWLALVAASLGRIVFVDKQTMLYRRHALAVTGGSDVASWKARFKRHVLAARKQSEDIAITEAQMVSCNDFLKSSGCHEQLLDSYVKAIGGGRVRKVRELRRMKIRRQGVGQELAYYLHILFGRGAPSERPTTDASSLSSKHRSAKPGIPPGSSTRP